MTYQIHKVEPIAKKGHNTAKGTSIFPFHKLEVGEGFFVPNKEAMPPAELEADAKTLQNMRNNCSRQSKSTGKLFRCALHSQNWIQVWREK